MPNERQNERYNTIPISVLCVPSSDEANDLYEAQHGQLTAIGKFGRDPLMKTLFREGILYLLVVGHHLRKYLVTLLVDMDTCLKMQF